MGTSIRQYVNTSTRQHMGTSIRQYVHLITQFYQILYLRTDTRSDTRSRQVVIIYNVISNALYSLLTRIDNTNILTVVNLKPVRRRRDDANSTMFEINLLNPFITESVQMSLNQQLSSLLMEKNITHHIMMSTLQRFQSSLYHKNLRWKLCLNFHILDDNAATLDATFLGAFAVRNILSLPSFCTKDQTNIIPPFCKCTTINNCSAQSINKINQISMMAPLIAL